MFGIPEELFSVHFVQFTHYVLDGVFQSRHDNVLDSVDTSIRCADDFVQDGKCRLQGSQLHQSLDGFGVNLFRFDDLLSTSSQSSEVEVLITERSALP